MSRFKVVLVNPPPFRILEPQYDTPRFGRMGLAYLAGYLRQHQPYDVEIVDAKFERLSFEATVSRVLAANPDVVGLGAFTCEVKPAAQVAAMVKAARPSVRTVIGGVHVTAIPEHTLREFPVFDIGVHGEGEVTFHELCESLRIGAPQQDIPGLVLRTPDGIVATRPRDRIADQDSIPFPAWDLLPDAGEYLLMTQRGCPFNCLFCMNPNGRTARARSIENFMQELSLVLDRHKPTDIRFGDELFSVNMDRCHELLDAMIAAGVQRRMRWTAQTHVHFVDYPLLKKMKEAGAYRIGMGIETGDAEVLKKTGKGSTPEMILKAAAAAKQARLPIETYFIMGHPNESLASMKRTVALAVKMNPDTPIFGIMVPFPGTEVGRLAAAGEAGYRLRSTNWDDYDKQIGGALEFANLSRQRIEMLQMWAYLKVFLWNRRFVDLVRFCWRYRREGFVVTKKIVFRRSDKLTGTAQPDATASTDTGPNREEIIAATKDWQEWQKTDLARIKKLRPGQTNVVFVELQKKRPPVETGAPS
jgi:anaerobic magnesium-protoporphyrin IX monomethyl ester cyclase